MTEKIFLVKREETNYSKRGLTLQKMFEDVDEVEISKKEIEFLKWILRDRRSIIEKQIRHGSSIETNNITLIKIDLILKKLERI